MRYLITVNTMVQLQLYGGIEFIYILLFKYVYEVTILIR